MDKKAISISGEELQNALRGVLDDEMVPNTIKHEAIASALSKALESSQVPMRYLLKVVERLHGAYADHRKVKASHEETIASSAKDRAHFLNHVLEHRRQLSTWEQTSRHLTNITHLKGERGDAGENGKDGKTLDLGEVVQAVLEQLPVMQDGKEGAPGRDGNDAAINHDEIYKMVLNRIRKEKPLDMSHVRGAQSFVKDGVRYKVEELMKGGGASSTAVYGEVVSGSGTSWTLVHTPISGTLRLYANGQRLALTTDYTLSGAVITTLQSWSAGVILADYAY